MKPKKQLTRTFSVTGKAFEKNERIFTEIFEIASEGITILDIETLRFVKSNTRARHLLKYPEEKLLNMNAMDISPEFQPCGQSSRHKSMGLIARALLGDVVVCEWTIVNGLGEEMLVEARMAVLHGYGQPHLYASFIDISDRKKAEHRIALQNKQLRDIAFLQSHKVRQPVAHILGLISLFDFGNTANPANAELLLRLKQSICQFDQVIHEVVHKTIVDSR